MMHKNKILFLCFFLSFFITTGALAAEKWDTTLGVQGVAGNYSGSELRDKRSNYGFFLTADYLDSYGFSFVYDKSKIDYKQGIKSIDQDTFFLSGRKTFNPDALNGMLTFSMDVYYVDNDDSTKATDNVKIYAPHISYLPYDKKFYWDLGYAHSDYYDNLTIDQLTPTIGFGFNQQRDWLQVRGYLISSSEEAKTQGQKSTEAVDVSLTHYFGGQTFNLNKIKLGFLIGERIYAVDRDAASVYNLADIQTGGVSLLVEFQVTEVVKLMVSSGQEKYKDKTIDDEYSSAYIYSGLTTSW